MFISDSFTCWQTSTSSDTTMSSAMGLPGRQVEHSTHASIPGTLNGRVGPVGRFSVLLTPQSYEDRTRPARPNEVLPCHPGESFDGFWWRFCCSTTCEACDFRLVVDLSCVFQGQVQPKRDHTTSNHKFRWYVPQFPVHHDPSCRTRPFPCFSPGWLSEVECLDFYKLSWVCINEGTAWSISSWVWAKSVNSCE